MTQEINKYIKRTNNDWINYLLTNTQIKINGFGRFKQTTKSCLQQFFTSDYEFIYYISGSTKLSFKDQITYLQPGDVILLTPHNIYSAQCVADEKTYYYYIHFDVAGKNKDELDYATIFSFNKQLIQLPKSVFPNLSSLFSATLYDWRYDQPGITVIVESLTKILLTYTLRQNIDNIGNINDQEKIILFSKCVNYMKENISSPLKIKEMCLKIGISESYLYKLFTELIQQSPSQYLMKLRLLKAEHLLLNSSQSIENIALSCGFSSSSHFSKNFIKLYKITPLQYINQKKHEKESRHDKKDYPPQLDK